MNIVILAGGSGTRLWPMSRTNKSKQFSKIIGNKTLLEVTLDRFKNNYPQKNIYISTIPQYCQNIKEILPNFPLENIIVEPDKRDTAAAMGYVASVLYLKEPDEPMIFVASDHYIGNEDLFINALKVAEKEIRRTRKMFDIGIVPDYPSTALGYTKIGKRLKKDSDVKIYEFLGHKEKPTYEKAKGYVSSGEYLWHGNFYMWTPRLFLKAFKKYAPDIYIHLKKIIKLIRQNGIKTSDGKGMEVIPCQMPINFDQLPAFKKKIFETYSQIRKEMIDYAITEKMDNSEIRIIKGEFFWSDVGNWNDLHKKLVTSKDSKGNLVKGDWVGIDTTQSIIYTHKNKLVATIGLDDIVIVDTPDALLVCPKGRAQDVKQIIDKIKLNKKRDKYL
ncbi:MAG: hypothetical protein GF335_00750 [Candidatus Moranbacteria bacterium]|nr:hypothetical protein [Candidatus Moranbacteria bacterium]